MCDNDTTCETCAAKGEGTYLDPVTAGTEGASCATKNSLAAAGIGDPCGPGDAEYDAQLKRIEDMGLDQPTDDKGTTLRDVLNHQAKLGSRKATPRDTRKAEPAAKPDPLHMTVAELRASVRLSREVEAAAERSKLIDAMMADARIDEAERATTAVSRVVKAAEDREARAQFGAAEQAAKARLAAGQVDEVSVNGRGIVVSGPKRRAIEMEEEERELRRLKMLADERAAQLAKIEAVREQRRKSL